MPTSDPCGFRFGGGQRRYRSANSTKAAYQITTRRLAAPAAIGEVVCLGDATLPIIPINGWKALRAIPLGKGANNATFNYAMFLGWYVMSDQGVDHVMLSGLCYGAATLSSSLTRPSGSAVINTGEIRADGITLSLCSSASTIRGCGNDLFNAMPVGSPYAYSPANNDEDAMAIIPDTYDADFLVIDDKLGTATEMNWLVERWRG